MQIKQEFALHAPRKKPYFEGWYSKGMEETFSFAIIIGIHYEPSNTFAFLQFMDTQSNQSHYEIYPKEDIHVEHCPFTLRLQENVLTQHHLSLHMKEVSGELELSSFLPIQQTRYMPTIMGPFSYLPMECVHSILSLRHRIHGHLVLAGQRKEIDGIGYMEKDRGSSFPQSYLWFQVNHPNQDTSFFLSIASIPLPLHPFTGVICILLHQGKQYRFASYLGGKITHFHAWEEQGHTNVQIELRQRDLCLQLHLVQQEQCRLHAPYQGTMNLKIAESLTSYGHILFAKGTQILYEETLYRAGFEYVGW